MGKKYDAVCDDLDDLRGELEKQRLRLERLERCLPPHTAWVPREEHERVHSQRDDLGLIVQDLSHKLAEARAERERQEALFERRRQEGQGQVQRLVEENGRLRTEVRDLTEINRRLAEEIADA